MIEKLKHKYALSDYGVRGMLLAIGAVTLSNIVLMMPMIMIYFLVQHLLEGELNISQLPFFIVGVLLYILLLVLATILQYNATFLSTYKESGIRRKALAEKLRKLPLSYFAKKDLSDLTNTIMTDCAMIETGSSHWIPELLGSILSTLLIGVSLFFFNWKMALSITWVIPLAFCLVLFGRKSLNKANQRNNDYKLSCLKGIQDGLETVKDLKSYNQTDAYLKDVYQKIDDVEKHTFLAEVMNASFVSSAQLLLKLGIGTCAIVGSILLLKGELSLLYFILLLIASTRLYDPLQISLQNLAAVFLIDISCKRMDEIFSHEEQSGSEELTNNGFDIVFDHVGFAYEDNQKVLNDVSFKAKQGEVTSLIGPSGGGKTTTARLASRFWDITQGKITVGGMDIAKVDPEVLLTLYSIVFQDVTLFNNSIMENIRIGNKNASDEEVIMAAKLAHCDEFVEKLPEKYNTFIGENGAELSGGERQRISIARAFLKDAPIIIMDEATASLDVDNESIIQESLSKLIENKTVLIIAHRMRTVANTSHIVVLKDGYVFEEGTPEELLKKDGLFAHMTHLQKEGENWQFE